MKKTEVYCDRCGKLIEENSYRPKYRIVVNESLLGLCDGELDLCDDCQERIDDYIDYTFHEDEMVIVEEKEFIHNGYWDVVNTGSSDWDVNRYNFDVICSNCGNVITSFKNYRKDEVLSDIMIGKAKEYFTRYCPECGSHNIFDESRFE